MVGVEREGWMQEREMVAAQQAMIVEPARGSATCRNESALSWLHQ
jgi:hypothetical protein